MKLTTKYLLALITTILLLNLSVAEAVRPPRTSGLGSLAYTGPAGPAGPAGQRGPAGPAGPAYSCTAPYQWGDPGPDGGQVAYVDGSGCHGLEVQLNDTNDNTTGLYAWANAITKAAAYNQSALVIALGCSTTTYPTAPAATPNCWHLPTTTEITLIYDNNQLLTQPLILTNTITGIGYWTSTQASSAPISAPDYAYAFLPGYAPYQFALGTTKTAALRLRVVRAF